MSDQTETETDHDDDGQKGSPIRLLRERADQAARLEAENAQMREELEALRVDSALRDLNLNEAQREAVLLAHKGEIDTEAYRETAAALQFVEPPQVPYEEQQAYARMAELTAAAMPSEARVRTWQDEIAEAQSQEQVIAILDREGFIDHQ